MDIKATINNSTNQVATIKGPTNQVNVSLPSSKNSSLQLKLLGDVDVTNLNDGAMLQYRESDSKFVARNEIDTQTGVIIFNSGNF
jgi:hypothetical protein